MADIDIKPILLETLCEFHSFCGKNDLEYFLVGGTLLGAVRHEGFIPWDDDADVVMPRKDYDRLLKLYDQFDYPFKLKSPKNIKNFRIPFAKLTNEKVIIEEGTHVPFRNGVWLDVFPLDYTFDNTYLQQLHFSTANRLGLLLKLKYDLEYKQSFSFKMRVLLPYLKVVSKFTPRKVLNLMFKINEDFPSKVILRKKNYVNLYGSWGIKEIAPISVFESKKLYDFEGNSFWGPVDYHFWLEKVYGDYMKLPIPEQRTSKHKIRIISSQI
ncbi:LicD family protein [uncultured Psychrobacter sp.]|uniref:LicD family protein n=1 Tax=uncultured Psychrobacter sp. TaxID=259303 RepID=UPI0026130CB5|nr:LicD family protein [uncultured Psychrobacter sp.]